MRQALISIIIIIWCQAIKAQPNCYLEEFSTNNGLNSSVQHMLQDRNGMMWFATWSGLCKYDSYTFRTFKSKAGDGSTMNNNRIISIAEGQSGVIWCKTYDNRAYAFDVDKEEFIDILLPTEKQNSHKNTVKTIYPLMTGHTWIVCEGGNAYQVDERNIRSDKKGIICYSTRNGNVNGNEVYDVFSTSDGDEWLLTDKGPQIVGKQKIYSHMPFRYHAETSDAIWLMTESGNLQRYIKKSGAIENVTLPLTVTETQSLTKMSRGEIGVSSNAGIIIISADGKKIKTVSGNGKCDIAGQDSSGNIWYCDMRKGIIRLSPTTGKSKRYYTSQDYLPQTEKHHVYFFHEFKSGSIIALPVGGVLGYYDAKTDAMRPLTLSNKVLDMTGTFLDKEDNLWFSSKYNLSKLTVYARNYSFEERKAETRTVYKDKFQRIWVSTQNGEVCLKTSDGATAGYLWPDGSVRGMRKSCGFIFYGMVNNEKGDLIAATRYDGLVVLRPLNANGTKYKIIRYQNDASDPYSISSNSLFTIFKDSKKRIWTGSYGNGVNIIANSDDVEHLRFINSNNLLTSYSKDLYKKVRYICECNGVIMICSTDGLVTCSNAISNYSRIRFYYNHREPDRTDALASNNVMKVFRDSRGAIYALCYGGGVSRIMSRDLLTSHLICKNIDQSKGIFSDLVMSMTEDRQGQLWITQEKALTRYNTKDGSYENYTKSFFLRDVTFSESLPITDHEGKIWQGTANGLMSFSPSKMKKRKFSPRIVFTEILSHNETFSRNRYSKGEVRIKKNERNFSISFAALDYSGSADNVLYAYKMDGIEKGWHFVGKSHTANYINMRHGTYTFMVKSTNSDGVWCDNVTKMKFIIEPTFWETPFAWLLYLLSAILLIGTFFYIRFCIFRLRHEVKLEQQMTDMKLKFFTDVSHELRTPLTLIAGPIEEALCDETISESTRNHLNNAKRNSQRMLELINQLLDFRKIQNRKMKLMVENVDIAEFVKQIFDDFVDVAKTHKYNYQFTSDIKNVTIWADKDKLSKVFYNIISNAFKYTPEGKSIKVNVTGGSQTVTVTVEDEGVGISQANMAHLFSRFETFSKTRLSTTSTGIGLSLAKEYADLHHASISVMSKEGCGSRFCVELKLGSGLLNDDNTEVIVNDGCESERNLITEEAGKQKELQMILIVEDNAELRTFLKNSLGKEFTVVEASNGVEGYEQAVRLIPDIIITDIMMPVMDGMEMIRKIKADSAICHTPLIILSAKASLENEIEGLSTGIDDYITKPFSASLLKIKIKNLLINRAKLQQFYTNKLLNIKTSGDSIKREPQESKDEKFMQSVITFIKKHISDTELAMDDMASTMNMSRSVFYKKLKAMTGLSPIMLVMRLRIQQAAALIDTGEDNISNVAYKCGFSDPRYFARCFKRFFNITPTEYKLKKEKLKTNNLHI